MDPKTMPPQYRGSVCSQCGRLVFCPHLAPSNYKLDNVPCANCFEIRSKHVNDKCIYGPTQYTQPECLPLHAPKMFKNEHFTGYSGRFGVMWQCLNCRNSNHFFTSDEFTDLMVDCKACNVVTRLIVHPTCWDNFK